MGETKKAIKQEIKAIYKNVLNGLDEEQKKLTSSEKNELREYIEELSAGTSHSFSHIFIMRKIQSIIKSRSGGELHDTGNIEDLVDDESGENEPNLVEESPASPSVNKLQDYYNRILEETKDSSLDHYELCWYRQGFIDALHDGGTINEKERSDLSVVFAPESNYYVEDGEVKNAEQ